MTKSYDDLKEFVKRYIAERSPGYLHLLNTLMRMKTGLDAIELFFNSPSAFYNILKEHYGDDAPVMFSLATLFLRAIAIRFNDISIETILLNAIKNGDDDRFFSVLKSHMIKVRIKGGREKIIR